MQSLRIIISHTHRCYIIYIGRTRSVVGGPRQLPRARSGKQRKIKALSPLRRAHTHTHTYVLFSINRITRARSLTPIHIHVRLLYPTERDQISRIVRDRLHFYDQGTRHSSNFNISAVIHRRTWYVTTIVFGWPDDRLNFCLLMFSRVTKIHCRWSCARTVSTTYPH